MEEEAKPSTSTQPASNVAGSGTAEPSSTFAEGTSRDRAAVPRNAAASALQGDVMSQRDAVNNTPAPTGGNTAGAETQPAELRNNEQPQKPGANNTATPQGDGIHVMGAPLRGGGSRATGMRSGNDGLRPSSQFTPSDLQERAKQAKVDEAKNLLIKVQSPAGGPFVDPTVPLTPPTGNLLGFDSDSIGQWIKKLTDHRVLVLECCDVDVLFSAVHAIAATSRSNVQEVRELNFGSAATVERDVSFMRDLCHPFLGNDVTTLVVAFADSQASDSFLQSVPSSPQLVSIAYDRLKNSRQVLVVTTPNRLRGAGVKVATSCLVRLDFLRPWLQSKFPDVQSDLQRDLEKQFAKGLWGPDEEEFHQRFRTFLDCGELKSAVDLRNGYMSEADPASAFHTRQDAGSADILRDDMPLENAVAFVATFFRRLPADDFQRVLLKLLGERTVEALPAGTHDPRQRKLRELWSERRQAILKNCRLRMLGAKPPTVQFETEDLRDALERNFESTFFFVFEDLCRAAEAHGLMFDPKEKVGVAAMELTARRIGNSLEGYGEGFLFPLLTPLQNGPGPFGELSPEQMQAVLSNLIGPTRHLVVSRLAALLNRLIENCTATAAEQALKILVDTGCHLEVLQLLPRVGHPGFADKRMAALKRIFNESNPEARQRAYQLLFSWVIEGGAKATAVLSNVQGWHDEGNSLSAACARQLKVDVRDWAVTSSTGLEDHPIASMLASEAGTDKNVMAWLLSAPQNHPAVPTLEEALYESLLEFLWIMPRPLTEEYFNANHDFCAWIQVTWGMAYEDALAERTRGSHEAMAPQDRLHALGIMDCAVALTSGSAAPGDQLPLHKLAAFVNTGGKELRSRILAHCGAVVQALSMCGEVTGFPFFVQDRQSIARGKLVKERWRMIQKALAEFRACLHEADMAVISAAGGR